MIFAHWEEIIFIISMRCVGTLISNITFAINTKLENVLITHNVLLTMLNVGVLAIEIKNMTTNFLICHTHERHKLYLNQKHFQPSWNYYI